MKIAVVTACNTNHLELALGAINSVKSKHDAASTIFCLDVGMDEASRENLEDLGVTAVPVGWDIKVKAPGDWFRVLTARPFIIDYIPGFDIYIWIDADCWVQDASALQTLVDAALDSGFAAAAQVHRGYRPFVSVSPRSPGIPPHVYYRYLCNSLLDPLASSAIASFPFLNGGVWAATARSSIWKEWQAAAFETYSRVDAAPPPPWLQDAAMLTDDLWLGGSNLLLFHADEVAFNKAAYLGNTRPNILDAKINWLCSMALPMMEENGILVDTAWPHDKIGIIHQTGRTKQGLWRLNVRGGGTRTISLRAPS